MSYIKVEGKSDLVRDENTKGIVNISFDELEAAKKKKELILSQKNQINSLENRINNIEDKLNKILNLLESK